MAKIFGYIISAVGIIGLLASTFPQIKSLIPFIQSYENITLTIISLIITTLGALLITRGSKRFKKALKEVPIYEGKNIIGYRRQ